MTGKSSERMGRSLPRQGCALFPSGSGSSLGMVDGCPSLNLLVLLLLAATGTLGALSLGLLCPVSRPGFFCCLEVVHVEAAEKRKRVA